MATVRKGVRTRKTVTTRSSAVAAGEAAESLSAPKAEESPSEPKVEESLPAPKAAQEESLSASEAAEAAESLSTPTVAEEAVPTPKTEAKIETASGVEAAEEPLRAVVETPPEPARAEAAKPSVETKEEKAMSEEVREPVEEAKAKTKAGSKPRVTRAEKYWKIPIGTSVGNMDSHGGKRTSGRVPHTKEKQPPFAGAKSLLPIYLL